MTHETSDILEVLLIFNQVKLDLKIKKDLFLNIIPLYETIHDLKNAEDLSVRLIDEFDKNEKTLSELEEKLTLKLGNLGEMFGVVKQVSGQKIEKYKNAPYRAPMVIVIVSNVKKHNRVPEIEQILSTASATQNILLALHALNYGAIWRTGVLALNDKIGEYFNLSQNQHILGYLYVGKPIMEPKKIPEINIEEHITRWV